MRLTLRTLLAYLDQVLDEQTAAEIAEKIRQSEVASEILQRIEDVLRRPKLGAPELSGRGMQVDPNTVAEYLDNVLSKEQVADFEKSCLESNTLLAEVASCHRVLANILDEPVEVPPECREKLYQLFQRRKELRGSESADSRKEQAAAPAKKTPSAGEDELLVPPPPRETNWRWLVAAALAAVLVVCTLMSVSPQGFWKGAQDQLAQEDSDQSDQPVSEKPSGPQPPSQAEPSGTGPSQPEQTAKPSTSGDSSQQPAPPPRKSEPPAPLPEPAKPVPRLPEDAPSATKDQQQREAEGAPADSKTPAVQPLPAPQKPIKPLPPPPKNPMPKPPGAVGKLTSQASLLYRPRGKENWDWAHENLAPLLAGDHLIVPYGFTATVVMNDGVQLQLFSQTQLQLPPVWPSPEKPLRLVRGRMVVLTPGRQVVRIPVQFGTLSGQVELLTPGATLACEVKYQRPLGTDLLQAPSQMVVSLFCVAGTLRWYDAQQKVAEVQQNGQIVLRDGQAVETHEQASTPAWLHRDALPQLIQEATLELLELLHQELDQADAGKDVEVVLREAAQQHRHIEVRYLALVHLMDLGIFDPAVDALREPRFRLGNHWEKLLDQMYQAAIVSPEAAQRVHAAFLQRRGESVGRQLFLLLRGFSREELMQEAVANQVVALLGHGDLDFRRMALWNLKRALEVRNTSYQPHAPTNRGMLEWRNRLQRLRKQAARVKRK